MASASQPYIPACQELSEKKSALSSSIIRSIALSCPSIVRTGGAELVVPLWGYLSILRVRLLPARACALEEREAETPGRPLILARTASHLRKSEVHLQWRFVYGRKQ